ncbi:hypothetical protein BJ741DRAFT_87086 [Chytriomyces cf. hyalinus JEL632]|nr:hypothetical protein BJ741DRAFT_87086 [Chytriomyces cf. hyalinus JEL632]
MYAAAAYFFVESDATGWVCTAMPGTDLIGSHPLPFVHFSGSGQVEARSGLKMSGNRIEVRPNASLDFSLTGELRVSGFNAGPGLSGGSGLPLRVSSILHLSALGMITSGSWHAEPISMAYGGTGGTQFQAGSIPFSNGSRLVEGGLYFDQIYQRLGINTSTPTSGLSLLDRDIELTGSSPNVLFTSDVLTFALRPKPAVLTSFVISAREGPGLFRDLIQLDGLTGMVNIPETLTVANSVVIGDSLRLNGHSFDSLNHGPFDMQFFSRDNAGCTLQIFGGVGKVNDLRNSERLVMGYAPQQQNQFIIAAQCTGTGVYRQMKIQSGAVNLILVPETNRIVLNADQVTTSGSIVSPGLTLQSGSVAPFLTFASDKIDIKVPVVVSTSLQVDSLLPMSSEIHVLGSMYTTGRLKVANLVMDSGATLSGENDPITGDWTLLLGNNQQVMLSSANCIIQTHLNVSQGLTVAGNSGLAVQGTAVLEGGLNVQGATVMGNVSATQLSLGTAGSMSPTAVGVFHFESSSVTSLEVAGPQSREKLVLGSCNGFEGFRVMTAVASGNTNSVSPANLIVGTRTVPDSLVLDAVSGSASFLCPLIVNPSHSTGSTLHVFGDSTFQGRASSSGVMECAGLTLGDWAFQTQDLELNLVANTSATPLVRFKAASMEICSDQLRVNGTRLITVVAPGAPDTDILRIDTLLREVNLNLTTTLTGLNEPVNPTDAATKNYVDNLAQGLDFKQSVQAASPISQDLTAPIPPTIDNVNIYPGDRILLLNQTSAFENGVYVVSPSRMFVRSLDFRAGLHVAGAFVYVSSGTVYGNRGMVCITKFPNDVCGANVLDFSLFNSNYFQPGLDSQKQPMAQFP